MRVFHLRHLRHKRQLPKLCRFFRIVREESTLSCATGSLSAVTRAGTSLAKDANRWMEQMRCNLIRHTYASCSPCAPCLNSCSPHLLFDENVIRAPRCRRPKRVQVVRACVRTCVRRNSVICLEENRDKSRVNEDWRFSGNYNERRGVSTN